MTETGVEVTPECVHNWVRQWNRWACLFPGCHTFRTLELEIEYEDPTGHIDPFDLEDQARAVQRDQEQSTKPTKRSGKKTQEVNTDGEVQSDLSVSL